jgi:hypothetical protein
MPLPEVSDLTEAFWRDLGFHAEDDEAQGYPLLIYCSAWNLPLEPIHEIIRERDGLKPWEILFDPDECPVWGLPHLSMYPGVVLQPGMSEEQQRNEIREPTGWKRGQPAAIKVAARRTLSKADARVIVRPRTPKAGMHYIRTLLSETPDPERTRAELRAALPPWEVLDYEAISGVSWADIAASFEDWSAVKAAFTDWADLADVLPTELPEP